MSSYIVDRTPLNYGGAQKLYLEAVKETVDQAVKQLHAAVGTNADLTALFHQVLDSFAVTRSEIAVKQGTENADDFGKRRDDPHSLSVCFRTSLYGPYGDYNSKILSLLQPHLRDIPHDLQAFSSEEAKLEKKAELPCCLSRSFSLEVIVLPPEADEKGRPFTLDEFIEIFKICDLPFSEAARKNPESELKDFCYNYEAMKKLKERAPKLYKRLKVSNEIDDAYLSFPQRRKSDWAVATLRLEIDGKLYALSQYVTWMYRDFLEDPVDKMSRDSVVSILHQDPFLIKDVLHDAGKLFKEIIEWDGKDRKNLTDITALWQYELAHAAPFKRGSAAINEWLEMMVYQFHGFSQFSYTKEKLVNLEALTSPLDEFVANYPTMIDLGELSR